MGYELPLSYYNMLGLPFFLGRDLLPEEAVDGKNHVVVLSHKLWSHLGADPKLVGRSMQINGEPYTVVGVLEPGLFDRDQSQLTVPLVFKPEQVNHDFHWLLSIGRLKPGVTVKQAQDDMDAVTLRIAQTYPKSNKGWGAIVEPLKNDFLPSERKQTLWLLLGAVNILLIAVNALANLLLARGIARQKELAVRSALGATRRTIFEQLLTESLLLSVVGGILGIGVGYAMLRARSLSCLGVLCRQKPICTSTSPSCFSPCWRLPWLASSSAVRPPGMLPASIPARRSRKVDMPASLSRRRAPGAGDR